MVVSQDSVFPSHDHSHLPSQSVVSAAQMGKYCFSDRRKYFQEEGVLFRLKHTC